MAISSKVKRKLAFCGDMDIGTKVLFKRMMATIDWPELTPKDLVEMLVGDPRTKEYCLTARAHLNIDSSDGICSSNIAALHDVKISIPSQGVTGVIMPRNSELQVGHPKAEKLRECVAREKEIRSDFGRVKMVTSKFNVMDDVDVAHIRYAWPVSLTLASFGTSDWQGLEKFKRPRSMPILTQEFRHIIRMTAMTLTMAMLLPEDIVEKSKQWDVHMPTQYRTDGHGWGYSTYSV